MTGKATDEAKGTTITTRNQVTCIMLRDLAANLESGRLTTMKRQLDEIKDENDTTTGLRVTLEFEGTPIPTFDIVEMLAMVLMEKLEKEEAENGIKDTKEVDQQEGAQESEGESLASGT